MGTPICGTGPPCPALGAGWLWSPAFPSQEGLQPAQPLLGTAAAERRLCLLPTTPRAVPVALLGNPPAWCWLQQDRPARATSVPFPAGQQPLTPALVGLESPREIFTFIPGVSAQLRQLLSFHIPGVHGTFLPPGTPGHGTEATNTSLGQQWAEGQRDGLRAGEQQPRAALSLKKGKPNDSPCPCHPQAQMPQPHVSVQVPAVRALCHPREPLQGPTQGARDL